MALHITDPEADQMVRHLAEARGVTLTEAIKIAVAGELSRTSLAERLRPLQDRLQQAMENNPLPPVEDWKAFYDSLEGDDLQAPIAEPNPRSIRR